MKKKKVLLADDDAAILEAVSLILEDEGYEVDTSLNGDVLFNFDGDPPDVLLLDLWMSGKDGRELCRLLKENDKMKDVPIIIVSANKDIELITSNCGADDFLAKPFEMNDLLSVIEKYANR